VIELLRIAALGGVLGLDTTGVGQLMVSRPIVAGALTGWVSGSPATGIAVGAILELYLLVSFPMGGAQFPDGSAATVVAVASATPFDGSGVIPLSVAVGLVWGQVAGATITGQRHLNTRLVPEAGESMGPSRVRIGHLAAIAADFVRAAVVTVVGVVFGRVAVGAVVDQWPLAPAPSMALLLVGGSVSLGILLNDLGGFRKKGLWLAAGMLLGLLGTQLL
jgi:mannose/fructose/N-acetylgalactosamine-specific phosphotransferase system component IIC